MLLKVKAFPKDKIDIENYLEITFLDDDDFHITECEIKFKYMMLIDDHLEEELKWELTKENFDLISNISTAHVDPVPVDANEFLDELKKAPK